MLGLIRAFAAVGGADPAKRQEMLALGISEALHNTALGLSIAVLAIVFHLVLGGMAKKLVADLESFSMKLENFLVFHARSNSNTSTAAVSNPVRGVK